jgi:glutamine synthetase
MLLVPDPTTAIIDPFTDHADALACMCDVVDPITREPYSRDPRNIARKAEAYLKSTGIADTAYFGPEAEFFVFDDVRFETKANNQLLHHRLRRGPRGTPARAEGGNLGYKPRQGRLLPGAAGRHPRRLRTEMVLR